MQCPNCGSWQTKVLDSRMVGDRRRRRNECYDCKHRFTTYEYHEEVALTIENIVEENKQFREVMKQISLLAKGGMNEQGSIDRQSDSTAKDSAGRRIKDRKV